MSTGIKLKGFIKKGEKMKGELAPVEIRDIQPQQEEFLEKKPSPMTTAIRQMFTKPIVDKTKSTQPIQVTATIKVKKTVKPILKQNIIPEEIISKTTDEEVEPEEIISKTTDEEVEPDEKLLLEKLENLLNEEQVKDPYINEIPEAYVPETRRGFSEFIKQNYSDFMLKPVHLQEPIEAGEKYPYQKFIREYIRQASPYRGILVYHGLGSGKTCSAIAASEALFATAHKKIIVMTPFSLRKNFLKEITFCGFRHFRLQNYWISLNKEDPAHQLFATEVLNISPRHLKTAKHIWVPDFEQTESNYNSLSSDDQTEIRKQILSILVYDSKINPTGRIRFINYNGISANKLKEIACTDPTFFDDSVLVVDEIHNLVRLITGKIEPYLTSSKGGRSKIVLESIGADRWKPSLCSTGRNYKRGYLFFRLLLSARNTKIIGLSGTPLINFPEELGVLSNILHGYIPVIEGIVSVTGDEIQKRIQNILLEYAYIDFVKVESDRAGKGIRFMISLLPEGIRKISNDLGVERIPQGENVPSQKEITTEIMKLFESKGFKFSVDPVLKALPLLPIFGEEFRETFIKEGGTEVINKAVLLKRLSGLISYYKGSRQDLMPKVIKDEVVRVPMSEYQQKKYSLERSDEIEIEKQSKKSKKSDIWNEIDNIAEMKNSTSYRMGSRQICNFAFPPNVTRPRPNTIDDIELEAPDTKDIIDNGSTELDTNALEDFPELQENGEENEKAAEEEEERIDEEELQKEKIVEGGAVVDCSDPEGYFENTANGDCLFDSIAQVYYPIDFKDKTQDFSLVAKISKILRSNLAQVYLKANMDEELRKEYSIPKEITDVNNKVMILSDYAKYILKPKTWGSDTDLEIISRLLEVPFKLIEHNPENEESKRIIRVIEKFGSSPLEEDYYTICNLDDRHFVLKKHNNPHIDNLKEIFAKILNKPLTVKALTVKPVKGTIKQSIDQLKLERASDCKEGKKKGETYKDAILRSKKCLVELNADNLRLDNPEGLRIYSPKYAAILQNIQNAAGSSLVYSQFLDMEGIGIFRIVMDLNGYAPIEIISTASGPKFSKLTEESLRKGSLQPRYITFSGAEKEDIRRLALDVFNARFNELPESLSSVLLEAGFENNNNKRGQICRVFCITSAGAEGLSLKNVRAVHIMEPYWNEVRLKQVKGRAIRIGSHLDLPKKDQNVSIYTYISVFGKEAQESKVGSMKIDETIFINDSFNRKEAIEFKLPINEGEKQYVLTSDEYLFVLSERKKKIIDELENVMKSSAIDCELNYAENKDGTFQCLSLKGSVGDFLYNPDLQTDIRESASMFQITQKTEQKKIRYFTYKGKRYASIPNEDKFDVYDAEDLNTIIGTMESKDGKPALPITFI